MKAKLGVVAVATVFVSILTGCAATVHVAPAGSATNAKCADVVVRLPQTVSTLAQRETDGQGTGAWGDPPDILLQCGVAVPDPTSTLECVTVDGIDWLVNDKYAPVYVFTTYGRSPAVTVKVNSKNVKADGNQALTDLSDAVGAIPTGHRCIAPSQVFENGQPVSSPTPTPTPTPTK
jgi:hypothetical protein